MNIFFMPRQARIATPGALHHIMVRGIERKKIFRDNKDRDDFLTRLGKILFETSKGEVGEDQEEEGLDL